MSLTKSALLDFRRLKNFYTVVVVLGSGVSDLSTQSCPPLATPWTVVHQTPLSMGSPREEYWSGFPFPSPGIKSGSPVSRQIIY